MPLVTLLAIISGSQMFGFWGDRRREDHFDIIGLHFYPWAITVKALQELEGTN